MTEATNKTFNEPQHPSTGTITTKQTQGFNSTERNVSTPISQPDTTTMQDLERPIASDEPPATWLSMGSTVPISETWESHSINRRVEPIAIKMELPLNETPLGMSSLNHTSISKNPAAVIPENTLSSSTNATQLIEPLLIDTLIVTYELSSVIRITIGGTVFRVDTSTWCVHINNIANNMSLNYLTEFYL
jgi:hypothetical protein